MERTIEVDKQIKIQKNLNSLNKFTKKKSIKGKKQSVSSRATTKNKTKPSIEMGMSQIFHPIYQKPLDINASAKASSITPTGPEKESRTDPLSNFVNKEMSSTVLLGKSLKPKSSLKKSGKTRKTLGLLNQSSAGSRSVNAGPVFQSQKYKATHSHSSSINTGHLRQVTLQPGPVNTRLIPPSNSQILDKKESLEATECKSSSDSQK